MVHVTGTHCHKNYRQFMIKKHDMTTVYGCAACKQWQRNTDTATGGYCMRYSTPTPYNLGQACMEHECVDTPEDLGEGITGISELEEQWVRDRDRGGIAAVQADAAQWQPPENQDHHATPDQLSSRTVVHAPAFYIRQNDQVGRCVEEPIVMAVTNETGATIRRDRHWAVALKDPDGNIIGRFVYDREGRSKRGQRLWFELYQPYTAEPEPNHYPDKL